MKDAEFAGKRLLAAQRQAKRRFRLFQIFGNDAREKIRAGHFFGRVAENVLNAVIDE